MGIHHKNVDRCKYHATRCSRKASIEGKSVDDRNDPILKQMKSSGSFPDMNFSSLSDLYGEEVNKVTIENLLAMQSGIPDFDTANPSRTGPDLDPFRATVYANPNENFSEPTLMSLPWVATHNLTSKAR